MVTILSYNFWLWDLVIFFMRIRENLNYEYNNNYKKRHNSRIPSENSVQ